MGRKKREWPLFFLCLSAALYGLALIFSATRYEETLHGLVGKQAVALGGGVVLCLLLSVLDVRKLLEKLWWLLPVVNVGLLLLLVPLGNDDGTGNKSWIALPARHTDFIFSVAGEELGLVGCLLILALLGAILFRCVWLAHRSRDPLFAAVAMGVAGVFGAQTILNIGMCLYVAPVVGVTLPFFSYGGSSLLTAFGGVGIVMSMKQEKLGGSGNWPGA